MMRNTELLFFCPRWGNDWDWDRFVSEVCDAGYDGIEWGITSGMADAELDAIWNLLARNNLHAILQHWETGDADFASHYDSYSAWFERINKYPIYKVNSHTGKEYFDVDQNISLVEVADRYTRDHGVPVVHETHRGRFLFAAHIARRYLELLPNLRLTLDISHWVTVAESYLADQATAIDLAFGRTDHLHARVGQTQSPQVADPRWPHWREATDRFFSWWAALLARKETSEILTVTPEFGPFPYMDKLGSGEPVSNQWELNTYMMNQLRTLQ